MFRVRSQIGCSTEYTGWGITAAVLDTGAARHPDYADRIADFADFVNGKTGMYDDDGHGTHVTGILGGNGQVMGGRYRGVAPKCRLVIGKVLNDHGDGTIEHMIRGMEWVMKNKKRWDIRILNISVGMEFHLKGKAREELLGCVEEVWDEGIVVAAAAGNGGPMPETISPIGAVRKVITVGCHEGGYFGKQDFLCENFSGRGSLNDLEKKPDIVAPGTGIISCSHQVYRMWRGWQNAYIERTGTSMATPMVSGAAALYLEKNPDAENTEVKRRMLYSAQDLNEPWQKQGWGMLDIKRMLS